MRRLGVEAGGALLSPAPKCVAPSRTAGATRAYPTPRAAIALREQRHIGTDLGRRAPREYGEEADYGEVSVNGHSHETSFHDGTLYLMPGEWKTYRSYQRKEDRRKVCGGPESSSAGIHLPISG